LEREEEKGADRGRAETESSEI
jgi:hypothetical protein